MKIAIIGNGKFIVDTWALLKKKLKINFYNQRKNLSEQLSNL